MKKIQIFIDHDIIVRHFLYNRTFSELEKHYDVQYVFPLDNKRVKSDINSLGLRSIIKIPINSSRIAKLRQLAKIQGISLGRKKRKYSRAGMWKMLLGSRQYFGMWIRSLPGVFPLYRDTIIDNAGECAEMEQVIDIFSADIILHPTVLEGLFIYDLTVLSKKKKIPFVALMNSWDNPSTKAQVIRPPDYLIVWGEQTKQHAVDFLEMRPEQVKIMGAAQFEVYRREPSKTREEICKSIGISLDKKLILYAGSSKSVNEMIHLQLLEKAIESNELSNCHVIFRPHPWRAPAQDEPDFYDIPWKHVSMDPSMCSFYNSPKENENYQMHLTDYMDTHNILSAIDLLISNMSTITLEGALHSKPVMCMVSDEDIAKNGFLRFTMNSLYFKELLQKLEIPRCKNYKDLSKICNELMLNGASPAFRAEQLEKVHYFVDLGNETYPVKLLNFIREVLSNQTF